MPKSQKPASDKISKDAIAQYLSADLASLTQRATHFEELLSNKINFYLIIVTAAIGGIILAAGIPEIQGFLLLLACLVLLILSIIGWVTLFQGLDLSANSTVMYRRMGRIRQWFLDQEPDLYPYLPFTPGDDRPGFYVEYARLRSVESILLIINATLAAAFGALLWLFISFQVVQFVFHNPALPYFIALAIGVVLFVVVWLVESKYTERFMKMRDEVEITRRYVHFASRDIKARFGQETSED